MSDLCAGPKIEHVETICVWYWNGLNIKIVYRIWKKNLTKFVCSCLNVGACADVWIVNCITIFHHRVYFVFLTDEEHFELSAWNTWCITIIQMDCADWLQQYVQCMSIMVHLSVALGICHARSCLSLWHKHRTRSAWKCIHTVHRAYTLHTANTQAGVVYVFHFVCVCRQFF